MVDQIKLIEKATGEQRSLFKIVFDVAKKIFDLLDDAWNILKGAIPPRLFLLIAPFLTGIVGFFINLAEAYQGSKEAWHAYQKSDMSQRKTRIAAGAMILFFGCVGAGLSAAFVAGGFGATVSGMMLMPALIPTLLLAVYATHLVKRAYLFKQAMNAEKKAINTDDTKAREARLKAERSVAFNIIEVLATSIVIIGTILSLSAIIGAATFASLGIAPLAILIMGVGIGVLCKYCEGYDEKHDFKYTRYLRHLFVKEEPLKLKQTSSYAKNLIPLLDTTSASSTENAPCEPPLVKLDETSSEANLTNEKITQQPKMTLH